MKLISEEAWEDVIGYKPAHPITYPTPPGFDLADVSMWTKGHPFDFYKKLREEAPVAWFDVPEAQGFWAVTRYEDIKQVELHPEIFSSQMGGINMAYGKPNERHPRLHSATLNTLISMDRPQHIDLRMQHRDFFTPQYVESLRERVRGEVTRLLDNVEKNGPKTDFVKHFSTRLPLFTLCEMMGIPERDRAKVVRWMYYLEQAAALFSQRTKGGIPPYLFIMRFMLNIRQMFKYGEKALNGRRANPQDDLMTKIAQATIGDEQLRQEFLDGAWLLIIFAGNDTTRNSLSGTMRLLTEFPDQSQRVLDDPSLIPQMAQEAVRMTSPVIHMRRTVTQDTELNGQKMVRGEKVIMWYGSANRDPAVFEDPDRFDVTRANATDHMAFGFGPHVCLGQRIAAMQIEEAYKQILERFPNIKWTGKQDISMNNFVHAINGLEVDIRG
ncbi:MAG: cytochrome P450 [Alphaproteobacteria bacterium]